MLLCIIILVGFNLNAGSLMHTSKILSKMTVVFMTDLLKFEKKLQFIVLTSFFNFFLIINDK